jgi:hypothetical protein
MKSSIKILTFLCLIAWLPVIGQSSNQVGDKLHSEQSKNIMKWISNLYEHGIRTDEDSLFISAEIQNILANEELKSFMYPKKYTWESTVTLLNKMELKQAFWFLINLYPDNRELVMKTILRYDTLFKMDEVLVSTYYTYSMIDPKVCQIVDGKPNVIRPDLVEEGLMNLKEMVDYVIYYRSIVKEENAAE